MPDASVPAEATFAVHIVVAVCAEPCRWLTAAGNATFAPPASEGT